MAQSRFNNFVTSWLINTLAVFVTAYIVSGIHWQSATDIFVASLVLGILNSFLRPILLLLALPLLIFSLGLFTLVINALVLYFVGFLLRPHFYVEGFWSAFFGALIISIIATILNALAGTGGSRVRVQRRKPPSNPPGGNGPIIDV